MLQIRRYGEILTVLTVGSCKWCLFGADKTFPMVRDEVERRKRVSKTCIGDRRLYMHSILLKGTAVVGV